jgi:hypothetical protein
MRGKKWVGGLNLRYKQHHYFFPYLCYYPDVDRQVLGSFTCHTSSKIWNEKSLEKIVCQIKKTPLDETGKILPDNVQILILGWQEFGK